MANFAFAQSSSQFFTKTLIRGSVGGDIRRLQEFLKTMPDIYPEGFVTGYFGLLTEKAVRKFQTKFGIVSSGSPVTTGWGMVGPKTRRKLNEFFSLLPSKPLTQPADSGPVSPPLAAAKSYDYRRHNLDIVYQFNTAPRPDGLPKTGAVGEDGKLISHPYYTSVYMATSQDGMTFTGKKLFIHHAGVPHIMLTQARKLVAIFQYFSPTDPTIFDVIAYTTSDDFGKTWSPVNRFYVKDLCPADRNKCNDPVLRQLSDGRYRLYFSHSGPQELGFWMYSAINNVLDTPFTNEGPQVNASDVADPAVVFFKNRWHYYANRAEVAAAGKFYGVRAVSTTGQNFTRVDDSIVLELPFLGDVIEDDGKLRFFNGRKSAYSSDGEKWVMEPGLRIDSGGDPGVVKLPDGSYIMLYVDSGPAGE